MRVGDPCDQPVVEVAGTDSEARGCTAAAPQPSQSAGCHPLVVPRRQGVARTVLGCERRFIGLAACSAEARRPFWRACSIWEPLGSRGGVLASSGLRGRVEMWKKDSWMTCLYQLNYAAEFQQWRRPQATPTPTPSVVSSGLSPCPGWPRCVIIEDLAVLEGARFCPREMRSGEQCTPRIIPGLAPAN
jgi:hypothetical protein